jgi:hypothetical protein
VARPMQRAAGSATIRLKRARLTYRAFCSRGNSVAWGAQRGAAVAAERRGASGVALSLRASRRCLSIGKVISPHLDPPEQSNLTTANLRLLQIDSQIYALAANRARIGA